MTELTALINIDNARWQSDWNGEDVGYPDIAIVGCYTQGRDDGDYSFYIDIINMVVLDFWKDDEDE